jgi:hypothetical protein
MGLLAGGSGAAFSSAAFQDSVSPSADFRIVAAGDLVVRRGKAFQNNDESYVVNGYDPANPGGSEISDFSTLSPNDLPVAWANNNEDGSLSVQLAYQNSSSGPTPLNNFLEIENQGTTTENVGINFDGGYAIDGSEGWTDDAADLSSYSSSSSEIGYDDIQAIFQFRDASDSSQISPSSPDSSETPINYVQMDPSDVLDVNLGISLTGNQVSTFAQAANVGTPFSSASQDGFQLLNQISVGTESTN